MDTEKGSPTNFNPLQSPEPPGPRTRVQDPEDKKGKPNATKSPQDNTMSEQIPLLAKHIDLQVNSPGFRAIGPANKPEDLKQAKKKLVSTWFGPKRKRKELDELKDSKLVQVIADLIEKKETLNSEHHEVIDKKLHEFCDTAKQAKWAKSEYIMKDDPCYRDLKSPDPQQGTIPEGENLERMLKLDEFTSSVASPNGKYAAAINGVGRIVVFNLSVDSKQPHSYRLLKKFNTHIPLRREEQSAQEYFDEVNEGSTNFERISYYQQQMMFTFSQDSETLFVSSIFATGAYDLRNFGDTTKELDFINIVQEEHQIESKRGELMFQYFFKNQFANSLYTAVDREVLVIGSTKEIRFIIFCLDNFKKTENSFLSPFNTSVYNHKSYSQVYTGRKSDNKKKPRDSNEDKEDEEKIIFVGHNSSNHLVLERNIKRKKRLEFYKMEFDLQNTKSKVSIVYKVDVPANITPFMKTIQPSGQELYCYNSKKSEIQIMKVVSTKINKTVEKKAEFEPVFKLIGKRKNLKHLAVKNDGKYLLIVDTANWAEVFIKTVKGYTLIHSFDANLPKRKISPKGNVEDVRGMTEQDLSDMDFIEDGSGIISVMGITLSYQQLNLPSQLSMRCLFNNTNFFNMNLRKRLNGSYSVWQTIKDTEYQKIVDFDPETNGGCIVRTFKANSYLSIEQALSPLGNIYLDVLKESDKASKDSDGNFKAQKDQLDSFLCGDVFSNEIMAFHIPATKQIIFLLKKSNQVIAFDREDIYNYMAGASDSSKKPAFPKPKGTFDFAMSEYYNEPYQLHMGGVSFDAKATHIIFPTETSDGMTEGVRLTVGMPKIKAAEFYFPLDKNRILISKITPSNEYSPGENDPAYPGALQIYNLDKDAYEGEEIVLKYEGYFSFMLDTPNTNVKALVGDQVFGLYDVNNHKLLVQDKIFTSGEETVATSVEYDTHCLLQSPDKKHIVVSSINHCDLIVMFSVDDKSYKRKTPNLLTKERNDLLNRWCFSHDSKYLLLVENDHIVVYSLALSSVVTKIQLDVEFVRYGKIMYINLYDQSTELEIAVGYKNNIFFKRIPFYPKARDLMFADLAKKMAEYESKDNDLEKSENAHELNEIMISMPKYQRYLDTTYLKLLCLTNDSRLVKSYFEGLKDTRDVIFNSMFTRLVTADKDMKKESVSCFIELLEYTVLTDGEMPPIDTNILLAWLKSDQMMLQDVRKLMHLITFKPTNQTLYGELKEEDSAMVGLPEDQVKKEASWAIYVEKQLFEENSANHTPYDLYRTAIKFDFTIGSRFSLDYFRWMEKMTDEDLKTKYKPIIYYKWYKIYWFAIVYSVVFWALNGLVCAFMAFAYDKWSLAIPIIVLSSLFLAYEGKCISADPKASLYDPWTYADIVLHLFSISCTLAVIIGGGSNPDYHYNWLRVTAFVVVSFRGMTMLRIFRGTRYFITMLFMTFYKMVAFLSVFAYIIFIYWFVCLVRPSLVAGGEDETFYNSVKQSMNIAFSNFDAGVDSGIVLITTIIGNVILALILLNYLIAIISKVYEDISEERDLYDIKMLLDIIVEFECFSMWKTPLIQNSAMDYCIMMPKETATEAIKDIKRVFAEEKKGLESDMKDAIKAHEKEITGIIEAASRENIETIKKELDAVKEKIVRVMTENKFKEFLSKEKDKTTSKEIKDKTLKKKEKLEKEVKDWKKEQENAAKGDSEKMMKIQTDYEAKMKKVDEKVENFRDRLNEGDDESEASEAED